MKTKVDWRKVTKRGALVALSICWMTVLTGCGDSGGGGGSSPTVDLAGTTWVEDGNASSTLTFYSDGTTFRAIDTSDDFDETGTCTRTGPNTFTVSISWDEGFDQIQVTATAIVDGNSMTVNGSVYVNGNLFENFTDTFTKQGDVEPPPQQEDLAGTTWVEDGYPTSSLRFSSDGFSLRVVDTSDGTDAAGTYSDSEGTLTFTVRFYDGPDLIEFRGNGSFYNSSMNVDFYIYVNGIYWSSGYASFTKQ